MKEWRNLSITVIKHNKEIRVFRINLRQWSYLDSIVELP